MRKVIKLHNDNITELFKGMRLHDVLRNGDVNLKSALQKLQRTDVEK